MLGQSSFILCTVILSHSLTLTHNPPKICNSSITWSKGGVVGYQPICFI